jgi:uncharacterized protein (DUF1501 family)
MQRRDFIKSAVAGWLVLQAPGVSAALNVGKTANKKKLVWLMLRGAMDSLHALPPFFDPHLAQHRANLIEPIRQQSFALARGFGLHPAFTNLHQWYQQGEFVPVVAVASGYRQRSHFDAQDQMESGLNITKHEDGWLARAVIAMQGEGLAISHTIPIALRGDINANSWFPSQFKPSDDDLLSRLGTLYSEDKQFEQWLEQAVNSRNSMGMNEKMSPRANFEMLAKRCGELLKQSDKNQCAMLEMGGWDTHNAQVNRLERQFASLDSGLAELKQALGDSWQDTVVMVSTEFGRTVAENGTAGTDHGTASVLFLAGGAIKGKQVLGEWPGLANEQLYENRDLKPTSDVRSWMAAVLQQHWTLGDAQISKVFPDVKPMNIKLML